MAGADKTTVASDSKQKKKNSSPMISGLEFLVYDAYQLAVIS